MLKPRPRWIPTPAPFQRHPASPSCDWQRSLSHDRLEILGETHPRSLEKLIENLLCPELFSSPSMKEEVPVTPNQGKREKTLHAIPKLEPHGPMDNSPALMSFHPLPNRLWKLSMNWEGIHPPMATSDLWKHLRPLSPSKTCEPFSWSLTIYPILDRWQNKIVLWSFIHIVMVCYGRWNELVIDLLTLLSSNMPNWEIPELAMELYEKIVFTWRFLGPHLSLPEGSSMMKSPFVMLE